MNCLLCLLTMHKNDLILYINVTVRVHSDDVRKKKKDILKLKLAGMNCNPQLECYDARLSCGRVNLTLIYPQKA